MAYVAPDTTIYVCAGVRLDATYEHTILFASSADAAAYFTSKAIATFSAQSYQRVRRGWLRIAAKADTLYTANYLCWRNGSTGHWFFAFVTAVEYINESTTEIAFEIDVMQTWEQDYLLAASFVDREHSQTDVIGDNLVPEDVMTGEILYEYQSAWGGGPITKYVVVASVEDDTALSPAIGGYYGGMFSGLNFLDYDTVGDAMGFVNRCNAAGKPDAILAIYVVPAQIWTLGSTVQYTTSLVDNVPGPTSSMGTWGLKNNKLYTYPYNYVFVSDSNGHGAAYRYEFFAGHTPIFSVGAVMSAPPECTMYPRNYRGLFNNYDEGLKIAQLPMAAYVTDAFKAWLAQNRNRIQSQAAGTLISAVGSAATAVATANPLPLLGVVASINSVYSLMGEVKRAELLPPQANANVGSGITTLAGGNYGWRFYTAHISRDMAERIDSYFSKYGYATRRVKVPNRNARPHWTYTRTVGCTLVYADCPADDARKICEIYDKGITFWRNASEVGNYNLDNSPAAGGQEVGGSNGTT